MTTLLVGCPSDPPVLLAIGNREVRVGETLEFIVAAQSGGSSLEFSAENLPTGAQFEQFADRQARFSWSPTAADIGDTYVDFHVKSGGHRDSERVIITVRGESDGGPEFIGQSTWTLEEDQKSIERIIEVRDPAASDIDWRIDNAPDGASFTPLFRQAIFFWEPTQAQRAEPQYTFTVTATNEHDEAASRVFTILIRDAGGGADCPDSKPVVESMTPSSMEGANDFVVTALVYDSAGEIGAVTLRWSDKEEPTSSDFELVPMSLVDDDEYRATVTLDEDLEPGGYVTVGYTICAQSDQGEGCEQESCTPRHTFTAQVRGGAGLCAPCGTSEECGTEDDLCLPGSHPGETFCGSDCSTTGSCPPEYECTEAGSGRMQCVPVTGTCRDSDFRPAAPGEIVINEILPAPPVGVDVNGDGTASTRGDEFVELVSVAGEPLDIGGFTISDRIQVRYTFPMGTVIPAGEAVVVFGGGDPASFTTDFAGAQVYSVLPSNPEGHGLVLRDAGDEVILRDPDFGLIAAAVYGDIRDVPVSERYSLTLEPQATGIVYVPSIEVPGGQQFAPGQQACGKPFPVSIHGGCGGSVCGNREPNTDQEPNDSRHQASCIDGRVAEIEGGLDYHGTESPTHPGPDPVDYYAFHAQEGDSLDIITFPCDSGDSVEDTYIEVLDATGRVLAENDDYEGSSPPLHAELYDHPITATGTYYLVVRTFPGSWDDSGCYLLWFFLSD